MLLSINSKCVWIELWNGSVFCHWKRVGGCCILFWNCFLSCKYKSLWVHHLFREGMSFRSVTESVIHFNSPISEDGKKSFRLSHYIYIIHYYFACTATLVWWSLSAWNSSNNSPVLIKFICYRLFSGYSIFKLRYSLFFFKTGQFLSTLGRVNNTGHKSQVIVLPIQKQSLLLVLYCSQMLTLGRIRPKVSFNECLGYFLYWQAMTCDLWPVTWVFYLPQTNLCWNTLTWKKN